MPILSGSVSFTVINRHPELRDLFLPIIGEYLVYLGALIRSFLKNEIHLNPQNGLKWPYFASKWSKNGPKWSFPTKFVHLSALIWLFFKNGNHLDPQMVQHGLILTPNGPKMFQMGFFKKIARESFKPCFSKSGLVHFQPTYDKEYIKMPILGLKRPFLSHSCYFWVSFWALSLYHHDNLSLLSTRVMPVLLLGLFV